MQTFLPDFTKIIANITKGNYDSGKEIDRIIADQKYSKEEHDFAEWIGLMSLKLEARELGLQETVEKLKLKNIRLTEAKNRNALFSTLFVSLFLSISLYVFLISTARSFNYESEYSARIVEIIFFTACFIIMKKSKFSFAYFGVTLQGFKKSIQAMLPGTISICTLLVVLKYICIVFEVKGLTGPLFIRDNFDFLFILYLPVVMIQEFLARGVIQTIIHYVITSKHSKLWAIITASSLFGLVHIQLSVAIALAAFVCSIYWGFVYEKSKTLVGVSISHLMIGDIAYILGFWDYLL